MDRYVYSDLILSRTPLEICEVACESSRQRPSSIVVVVNSSNTRLEDKWLDRGAHALKEAKHRRAVAGRQARWK